MNKKLDFWKNFLIQFSPTEKNILEMLLNKLNK